MVTAAKQFSGLLLLGIVVWQFTKARIDRKIREEMPDDDEEMEEGGEFDLGDNDLDNELEIEDADGKLAWSNPLWCSIS